MIIHNLKKKFFKKYNLKNKEIKRIKKEIFNDTEINIFNIKSNKNDTIIYNFYKDFNIKYLELLMILYKYKIKKLKYNLILPYFPYCRQNKKKMTNLRFSIFGIKKMNPNKVITFDIHDSKLFDNSKIFKNISTYKFIENIIKKKFFSIVFPDKGSFLRYKKIIKKNKSYLIFKKNRKKNKIKIKKSFSKNIKKSKNFLIIDDIVDTGKTIKKIVKKIKKYKKNIYLYATHFLMKNDKVKKFLKNFKKIYTTNSFFIKKNKKLKIFNIFDLIKNDKSIFKKKKTKL
ncbi:phosphoribosyltransferase family protein [Candidatus Vidania fulgoroideorum]